MTQLAVNSERHRHAQLPIVVSQPPFSVTSRPPASRPDNDYPYDDPCLKIGPDEQVTQLKLPVDLNARVEPMHHALGSRILILTTLIDELDIWSGEDGPLHHHNNAATEYVARSFGELRKAFWGPVLLTLAKLAR